MNVEDLKERDDLLNEIARLTITNALLSEEITRLIEEDISYPFRIFVEDELNDLCEDGDEPNKDLTKLE